MRIWITGANGFAARAFVSLVQQEHPEFELHGFDLSTDSAMDIDAYHCVNLIDLVRVTQLAKQYPPTHVLHCAAAIHEADFHKLWDTNVQGTLNLFQALNAAEVSGARVVSVGSAAEYAPTTVGQLTESSPVGPQSDYGRSKLAQSLVALSMAALTGQEAVVARTFNVIGEGMSQGLVPGALLHRLLEEPGDTLRVQNSDAVRDFLDIRDVARAYLTLLTCDLAGEIVNVCSGTGIPIGDLANRINEKLNSPKRIEMISSEDGYAASVYVGSANKYEARWGPISTHSLDDSIESMIRYGAK